jgi:hypothetical protein
MPTTNFPNGVTNAAESSALGSFGAPDPSKFHQFFDDFDTYQLTEWTQTLNTGTIARGDQDGGVVILTTVTTTDNAFTGQQHTAQTFLGELTKKLWFKSRFKLSDAIETDGIIGLYVTDTDPVATLPTDGIFFMKDDGDALLDFHVRNGGVSSSLTGIATLVNDTFVEVAFYYDKTAVLAYVNGIRVGSLPLANFPSGDLMRVSMGVQNGSAVGTRVMTVDHIFVAKQRDAEIA